ncbi:methyltransferase domain-containing protein [Aquibacillus halophilus]|uniref:Methyltransferase domain-containing protein n=1 Tax=Aquibacillus halophilus TaxID=930132 RepID=A0A6A8DD84_9BACI|nr:class I SAM-dependent methyltransferase [Aquibacillus halophilus]MRH43643.1 methyltransferase domain-containing protein [Aquibacillus halophilus]
MLEDTGERVIPEYMKPMNKLLLEHIARYQFVLNFVKGRVLDLSCGSGFGTHLIAKDKQSNVDEVIGVDIDPKIIKYAKSTYYHPKSFFQVEDAIDEKLVNKLGLFDTIVSFETLEHIEQEEKILSNYYSLLKKGGTVVISTPFGKGRGIPCGSPFHVHQLTPEEFYSLFDRYSQQEFYCQKGVLIEPFQKDRNYPLGIAVCTK